MDWSLYGPKLAQVALTVGADDVDGVSAVETGSGDAAARRSRRSGATSARPASSPSSATARFEPLADDSRCAPRRRRVSQRASARLRSRALAALFSLRFDVPSTCAALLHEGAIDVGLIPSIEYLRGPEPYRIVPGPGDRLATGRWRRSRCSRTTPIEHVRSIALDTSSRTSAALVRVLCARRFGIEPRFDADAARTCRDARAVRRRAHHRRQRAVPRPRGARAC